MANSKKTNRNQVLPVGHGDSLDSNAASSAASLVNSQESLRLQKEMTKEAEQQLKYAHLSGESEAKRQEMVKAINVYRQKERDLLIEVNKEKEKSNAADRKAADFRDREDQKERARAATKAKRVAEKKKELDFDKYITKEKNAQLKILGMMSKDEKDIAATISTAARMSHTITLEKQLQKTQDLSTKALLKEHIADSKVMASLSVESVKNAAKLTLFEKEALPYADKLRSIKYDLKKLDDQAVKGLTVKQGLTKTNLEHLRDEYTVLQKLEQKNKQIEKIQRSVKDLVYGQGTAFGQIMSTLKDIITNPLTIFTGLLALGVSRFEEMRQRGVQLAEELDRVNKKLAGAGPYQEAIIKRAKRIQSIFSEAGEGFASSLESAVDAVESLEKQLGKIAFVTPGLVDSMTKLKLSIGLSDEESAKVINTFMLVNQNSEEAAINSIEMLNSMAEVNGLSPAEVFREAAGYTGEMAGFIESSGAGLNNAIISAKRMGLGLEDIAKVSRGLLDFETSLNAQMEAQVLTGMNINFNKARQFAMNKQGVKATEEVLRQVGGLERFQKMNVFQQDAIARATGLTVTELLKTNAQREREAKIAKEKQKIHADTVKMLPVVTSVMGRLDTGLNLIQKISKALGDIVLDVFGVSFHEAEALIMKFVKSDAFTTGLKNVLYFMKGIIEGIKDSVSFIWDLLKKLPFVGDFIKNIGKTDMSGGYGGAQDGGNIVGKVITGMFLLSKARALLGMTSLTAMWVKNADGSGMMGSLMRLFGGKGSGGKFFKGGQYMPGGGRAPAGGMMSGGGSAAGGLSGMQVAGYGAAALTIGKGLYDVASTTQENTGGERAANIGGALGAIGGAKAGAALGSFFGPVGTAVGAGVGALIGYVSGRLVKHVDAFKGDLDKIREKSAKNRVLHDIENSRRSAELQKDQLAASQRVQFSFRNLAYDTDGLTNNELKSFAKAQLDAGNVTKDEYHAAVKGTLLPLDFLRIAANGASDALGINELKRQDYINERMSSDDSVYNAQQRIAENKISADQLDNLSDKQIENIVSTKYSMFFEKDSKKDTQAILKEMHDATGIPIKELQKAVDGITVLSGFYMSSEGKAETIAENIRDEMKLLIQTKIEADQLYLDKKTRQLGNEAEEKFPRLTNTNGIPTMPVTVIEEVNKKTYARGGTFAGGGVLYGPSHGQGGIQTRYGELEGGETVINKKSSKLYKGALSQINQAGGGISFDGSAPDTGQYGWGWSDLNPIKHIKKAYKSTTNFVKEQVIPYAQEKYDKYAPDAVKAVVSKSSELISSGKKWVAEKGGQAKEYLQENGGRLLDKYIIEPLSYVPGIGPSVKTMFGKEARDQYGQMWRGELTPTDFLLGKPDKDGNRSGGLGSRMYTNQAESLMKLGEGIGGMSEYLPQPLKFVGQLIGDIPQAASRLMGGQRDPKTGEFSADPMNSTFIDIFDPASTWEERLNGILDVVSVIPLPAAALGKIAGPLLKAGIKGGKTLIPKLVGPAIKTGKGLINVIKTGAKKISPKGYKVMEDLFGTLSTKAKGLTSKAKDKYKQAKEWLGFGGPKIKGGTRADMRFASSNKGIGQYWNKLQQKGAGVQNWVSKKVNKLGGRTKEFITNTFGESIFKKSKAVKDFMGSVFGSKYIGGDAAKNSMLQVKNPLNILKYVNPKNLFGKDGVVHSLYKKFALKPAVVAGGDATASAVGLEGEGYGELAKNIFLPNTKIMGIGTGLHTKMITDPLIDSAKDIDWNTKYVTQGYNKLKDFKRTRSTGPNKIGVPVITPDIYDSIDLKGPIPKDNRNDRLDMPGPQYAARGAVLRPRSYMGGGFTGPGSRMGGLDGFGGMPAMVHPNETITDNTVDGNGGGNSEVISLLRELIIVNKNVKVEIDGKAVASAVDTANYLV